MHTHRLTSVQSAWLVQIGHHILSQSLKLCKLCITFGDLQLMQLLNGLCAAHRDGQASASSKRHMGAHEVARRVFTFKKTSATPLAPGVCNCELVCAL